MHTTLRRLPKSVIVAAASILLSPLAMANPPWARDYIGEVNFRLTDNPKLSQMVNRVSEIKTRLAQVERQLRDKRQKLKKQQERKRSLESQVANSQTQIQNARQKKKQLQAQKQTLPREIAQLKSQIANLTTQLNNQKQQLANLQSQTQNLRSQVQAKRQECKATPSPECRQQLKALQQKMQASAAQAKQKQQAVNQTNKKLANSKTAKTQKEQTLANIETLIAKQDQTIQAARQEKKRSEAQLTKVITNINATKAEIAPLDRQSQKIQVNLADAQAKTQDFRQRLINRILDANAEGARNGGEDGRIDGQDLAGAIGRTEGRRDGDDDGVNDGTRDGRDRDYRNGFDEGLVIGADRAKADGEANGSVDGTRDGNIDAAEIAGRADGTDRANRSDASQVGTQQGKRDGFERAVQTGERNGTAQGESDAINKYENAPLAKKQVQGNFAGAFSRNIPSFPAGHRGPNFNPDSGRRGRLVDEAYSDGYRFRYRRVQRRAFERNIADRYNANYDEAYRRAYNDTYSRYYDVDFKAGKSDGDKEAYDRNYPVVYKQYYDQFRQDYRNNPNTGAPEYKSTYQKVESATYNRVYEEIRSDFYNRVEEQTFQANIEAQTNIYREKRFAAVESIYTSSPVLKFVSSSIVDGGVQANGGTVVAAKDGIFQPNEAVFHNVKVTNYSTVDATGVQVVLSDGSKVTLPTLPAQSETLVKGAARSNVSSSRGGNYDSVLSVYSKVTRESKIQARHFYNPSQGQLNAGDKKRRTVQLPLSISSLNTKNVLVINEQNNLVMQLNNKSTRSYQGPIEVVVDVNSNSSIITKGFNSVQTLSKSATLSDAILNVNTEADTYTPLTFTAKVMKNGVTLGTLDASFTTMAKAPYSDKGNAPVVVANSEQTRRDLVDLVSDFGGISKVSVLDLSLAGKNSRVLNGGINAKTLLVIDNGSGSVFKGIDTMMSKSANSVIVALDDADISSRVKSMKTFARAINPKFRVAGIGDIRVLLSNPLRDRNHKNRLMAMRADRRSYNNTLALARELTLTNDQMIAKAAASMNESNFFNPAPAQVLALQAMNMRVNHEILSVNDAYMESGNLGNRDKNIAKLVRKDSTLLHNKLAKKVGAGTSTGMYLVGYDTYWAIKALNDNGMGINLGRNLEVELLFKGFGDKKAAVYPLKRGGEKKLSRSLRKQAEKNKAKYRSFKYDGSYGNNSNFGDDNGFNF